MIELFIKCITELFIVSKSINKSWKVSKTSELTVMHLKPFKSRSLDEE